MFRLFHPGEKDGEVRDARSVRVSEFDSPMRNERTGHDERLPKVRADGTLGFNRRFSRPRRAATP